MSDLDQPNGREGMNMDESVQLTAEHYQKTHELTLQMWEQRNTTFLLLLVAVGSGTILTYNVPQARPLLVDVIAKLAGITTDTRITQLRQSFPYGVVQGILLVVILYLMIILYHRTVFIQRCYAYLGEVEPEIRKGMNLPGDTVAFTRESSFYESHRPPFGRFVANTYIGMLGLLIVAFMGSRIYTDFRDGHMIMGVVDLIVAAPMGLFFYGYARSS